MSEPGAHGPHEPSRAATPAAPPARPASWLVRALRAVARALLLAFAFGFAVGTLIRCQVERRTPRDLPYLGGVATPLDPAVQLARRPSDRSARPGDVGDVPARVLVARDHE